MAHFRPWSLSILLSVLLLLSILHSRVNKKAKLSTGKGVSLPSNRMMNATYSMLKWTKSGFAQKMVDEAPPHIRAYVFIREKVFREKMGFHPLCKIFAIVWGRKAPLRPQNSFTGNKVGARVPRAECDRFSLANINSLLQWYWSVFILNTFILLIVHVF